MRDQRADRAIFGDAFFVGKEDDWFGFSLSPVSIVLFIDEDPVCTLSRILSCFGFEPCAAHAFMWFSLIHGMIHIMLWNTRFQFHESVFAVKFGE